MSSSRRGVSQTPFLIVFIILTFLASLVAYMFSSNLTKQKEATDQEKRKFLDMERKFEKKWQDVKNMRTVLGFYEDDTEGESTETDTGMITAELERINNSVLLEKSNIQPLTIKLMLNELSKNVQKQKLDVKNAKLERDNFQSHWKGEEEEKRRIINEKNQEITDLRDRAQRAQDRLGQEIEQKEGQITELRDRNTSLHGDLEKSEAEKQSRVQELTTNIKQLKGRVDQLTEEEKRATTLIPDGEVIRADIDHGFAYIDLGWKHGVKPGSRFKVYEVLKGGRRKHKGEVRIIRVEKDFSQCSILAMSEETNPIVKGDYIWNKFFERNIKKRFAFIGKFDTENAKYSKEQLKRIIEENGHIATEVVRADTDYVILGDEHTGDAQWKTVQDFKIEKLSPKILLQFFGYGAYRDR